MKCRLRKVQSPSKNLHRPLNDPQATSGNRGMSQPATARSGGLLLALPERSLHVIRFPLTLHPMISLCQVSPRDRMRREPPSARAFERRLLTGILPVLLVWFCAVLGVSVPVLSQAQIQFSTSGSEYSPIGILPGDQAHPSLSITPSGGFLVWEDNAAYAYHTGLGIRAQALGTNLVPTGSPFRVNKTGGATQDHENGQITVFPGGGAVFVWQGGRQGLQHIYARFLTTSNTWAANDVMVNTVTTSYQSDPSVAVLTNGNVVIVWSSFNEAAPGSMSDVYGAIFSPNGQRLAGEFLINQFVTYNQRNPKVAALNTGGFVAAWISEQQQSVGAISNGPSVDVFARQFYANGAAVADEAPVNTTSSYCGHPFVVPAGDGFLVAWDQFDSFTSATGLDVFTRVFGPDGSGGPTSRLNTYTNNDQYAPRVVPLNGGFLALWTSVGQDGSGRGVFGQYLASDASAVGSEFQVNTSIIGDQQWPFAGTDGSGRAVAAWTGFSGRASVDLFAQNFTSPGYTPVVATNLFAAPPAEIFPDDLPILVNTNPVTGGPGRGPGPTNQTASVAGSYNGLFYDSTNVSPTSAGFFTAKITSRGSYSARLSLAGKNISFSGILDASGHAVKSTTSKSSPVITLELQAAADTLTGTVSSSSWSSSLIADRLVYASGGSVAPQRGAYSLVLPPDSRGSSAPAGDGFASIKVDSKGGVQLAGALADGTKVSQKVGVSSQGYFPLYASLYGGSGLVISWMQFSNQVSGPLAGETIWSKSPGAARAFQKSYVGGFTNDVYALGSTYQAPMGGRRVLNLDTAALGFSGGGLANFVTNSALLELNNKLVSRDGNKLTFSLNAGTGTFKGTAGVEGAGAPITFQGVVFQSTNIGLGYFMNGNLSGQFYLGSPPAPGTNATSAVTP
jgi:hypothetical protein